MTGLLFDPTEYTDERIRHQFHAVIECSGDCNSCFDRVRIEIKPMNHEIPTICPNCGHEYDARLHWLVCPRCGHQTERLTGTDAFGLTDQEEENIIKQW